MKFIAKSLLASGLIAGSALAVAGEAPTSPITGSVAFTTDYVFRGLSQTQTKPAIQGGLTYTHNSGLHAGLWGSNVEFESKDSPGGSTDNVSMELDYTVGYGANIGNAITWDLTAAYYSYPGTQGASASGPTKYGFWEILPTLTYDFGTAKLTGLLAYSPNFFGAAKAGTYLMAGLDMPLPADFALNAHVGMQWFDADKDSGVSQTFVNANTSYVPKDYSEWKLGVSKQIAGVGLELAYFGTSLSKDKCTASAGQKDLCSSRAVLTVSKSF
jgi:uncharacterized protein (TIGR02001 family)